jgi:deoxyribodipyrimidine photolyase
MHLDCAAQACFRRDLRAHDTAVLHAALTAHGVMRQ